MTERFIVDGYDLYAAYKVIVKTAEGLDVIPKVKSRDQHSWPDESGVDVATNTGLVYDAMDVSLSCVVVESTYKEAIKRINGLIALLSGSGLHLLGSVTRGRLYPVLLDSISSYKRVNATSNSEVWIEFTLKLLCPLPECRMGSATITASGAVSLNANTAKQVTVWWGDGTTTTGTGALNHTYTNAGTYTVLIAGTGVTKSVFTTTVIAIDEYSYPASGDVQNVDVSHTSEETWNALQAHLANLSPEYSDAQLTSLKSVEASGIIPTAEATWLGATAKSVLSYLQKLVSKVYAIDGRVSAIENNVIYTETLANDITAIEYKITGLNLLKNKPYRLLVFCPTNGLTQGVFLLRFNNDSRIIYQRSAAIATAFQIVVGYTATRASFEFVLADNGDLWGRDWTACNNGGSYIRTGEINATYGAGWSNISVISIFRNNMAKIPAGSVITLIRG